MVDVLVVETGELGGLLATLLEQDGIAARWVKTAEQALEEALQQTPKVVVVEAEISEHTGLEMANLLHSDLDAQVVMTYRQESLSRPDGPQLQAGMAQHAAHFKKPFRSRALIEEVAGLLGHNVDRDDVDPSLLEGAPVLDDDDTLVLDDVVDIDFDDIDLDIDDSAVIDTHSFVYLTEELEGAELSVPDGARQKGATKELPERDKKKTPTADLSSLWLELKAAQDQPDDIGQAPVRSLPPTPPLNTEEGDPVDDETSFAGLNEDQLLDATVAAPALDAETLVVPTAELASLDKELSDGDIIEASSSASEADGAPFEETTDISTPVGKPLTSSGLSQEALGKGARPLTSQLLAETLDALHQSETTSEVLLKHDKARRVLLLMRGVIVGVRSNLRPEELPFIAKKRKLVDDDQLREAMQMHRAKQAKTLVHALQQVGVEESALRALLDEQVRRVVLGAFAWQTGTMEVSFRGLAKREALQSQMSVADAVVRSIVLTEPIDELRKAAPDDARFAPNPDSSYGLHDVTLTADEARLVVAMDGTKTLQDLATLYDDIPERVLRGLAAGLFRVGLLRFAGFGPAEARRISFF